MSLKPNCKLLYFTGFLVFLLGGAMCGRTVLASHHKAQIAFTSTRDGNPEIYVMDSDGTNQKRLTENQAENWHPAWFPDGTKIAFVSNQKGGFGQIYVMDADGKNRNKLTDGERDENPDWSPDGQKIAFTRRVEGRGHVAVMDADGHNVFKLTDGQVPSWSPDGQKIAFEFLKDGINQVFQINGNGQGFNRVTHDLANKKDPAWAPNGQQIAYGSLHEGFFQIYVVDADGRNRVRLTHNKVHHWHPAWSPDGQTIAYAISDVNVPDRGTIHLMTADGIYLKQLSDDHNAIDTHPDFGPVGRAVSPTSKTTTTWGRLKKLTLKLR